ncbi:hypothetical protein F5I97DRAFT_1803279 [Phlebopus sp. FC_14]|nr:hypothetical protein F5I97DRAFT_1803279 [Phlebopus sp. FC_14]
MVNVNAQFPFNLHNKDLDEPSPSRSSRNVSGGTRASSRQVSPSPHRSLQKSQSSTSIHHDTDDLTSFRNLRNASRPPPVLNVRLVSPTMVARNGTSARGRPGRHTEPSRGAAVAESGLIVGTELGNEFGPSGGDNLDEESTPRAHAQLSGWEDRSSGAADSASEAENSQEFRIQDAGAVSRSWGD